MISESPGTAPVEEASPPAQSKQPGSKYEFEGHENIVWDFVFLHDNIHVVSGSADGTMRKWSCDTGLAVGEPWNGEGGRIYALALSPDGKKIACGRGDGSVQQWNTEGKMIEGIWTGHNGGVRSLSWSPSGDHIASGSNDGRILIRKAGSGDVEVGPIESKQVWVLALAYSPSGDRIASGGSNKTICIWDSKTGQLVVGPIEGLGTSVTSVAWSLDSTKLYAASDNFTRVFDNSGTQLHRLEQDFAVNSVALSRKHNLLVCVGYRGIAQLWDTASHQPLGQSFHRHEMDLCCASFSPDGRYLVYGGYDHKMSLWVIKDIAPDIAEIQSKSPSPSLKVDATNRHAHSGDDGEDVGDDYYGNDNFFQSSYPSALSGPSRRSRRRPRPSFGRRFLNVFTPSRRSRRHPRPSFSRRFLNVFTPSQQRHSTNEPTSLRRRLFARHTGPQPVTFSAGRAERRVWVAPVRPKAQAAQSSSQTAQPASVVHPQSTPQPQPSKTEPVAQVVQQQEYDGYGCWDNFWLALGCIPRRSHRVVSQAAAQLPIP